MKGRAQPSTTGALVHMDTSDMRDLFARRALGVRGLCRAMGELQRRWPATRRRSSC